MPGNDRWALSRRCLYLTDMKNYYLGIDLGTSAIKLLAVSPDGERLSVRRAYDTPTPEGWLTALKSALAELPSERIAAIALSSQVGTYLTDTGAVLNWNCSAGSEELAHLKATLSDEAWLEAIGMVHPELVSYPLPRLLYIASHFPEAKAVEMPKELLIRALTGNTVTDIFSWRGLCHPEKKAYADTLLTRFGISLKLPPVALPTDLAGTVTPEAANHYGLPQGIPVYVGCNDFFAGLLGMGIYDIGTAFALYGTSAHVGMITQAPQSGRIVSGPYFHGCATYGGTKASGASCDFAMQNFGIDGLTPETAFENPPIFLPYLAGERAPIYDENAKGVFFGITDKTSQQHMAYAVLEGVVFSLYHIYTSLNAQSPTRLITGGGSAVNPMMAKLKASLFDCEVFRVKENDASALGAALLAMTGSGIYASIEQAAQAAADYELAAIPDERLGNRLQARFSVYQSLYGDLKHTFEKFREL